MYFVDLLHRGVRWPLDHLLFNLKASKLTILKADSLKALPAPETLVFGQVSESHAFELH